MKSILLISGLIALSGACAQVQTTTQPSRTDIIASCIRGFHNDLVKLEQTYPQLNGIAKTKPASNTLSFANGEIKGTKKEIASYSHLNACIIYLSISDRKGISEETISQREMVLPDISASETWTLIVNPEGERASEFRSAVQKLKQARMKQLHEELKEQETVQQRPERDK